MLVQYQKGWADLVWAKELSVRGTRKHKLLGGVFAHVSDDNSTVHFKRLPSRSRNIEERDWAVDIRRFNREDFVVDPAQDLLIIVAQPERSALRKAVISLSEHYRRSPRGRDYQIFSLTASTGDPHPLGSGIFTHTTRGELHFRMLCEDILCLMFKNIDSGEMEIAFWNWKAGSILAVRQINFMNPC